MMLKKTKWLKCNFTEDCLGNNLYLDRLEDPRTGFFVFCGYEVLKYFDLPMTATKARFVAYDRPSQWRVPVTVWEDGWACPILALPGDSFVVIEEDAHPLVRPFIGKTIYVELEYKE